MPPEERAREMVCHGLERMTTKSKAHLGSEAGKARVTKAKEKASKSA